MINLTKYTFNDIKMINFHAKFEMKSCSLYALVLKEKKCGKEIKSTVESQNVQSKF